MLTSRKQGEKKQGKGQVEPQHLKFSVGDGIALITLHRPEAMNAFSPQMLQSWFKAITNCEESEDVRVVILTGAGTAFCAGGDIFAEKG
ncbi:MAG: enoyl-CoA hydratase/isomerase family protein, partial [Deltaproteobacteria bacterium]|nr:enoyl-CoA hydratase/isomerase family protein [Deltaproteobacteria bacterium]